MERSSCCLKCREDNEEILHRFPCGKKFCRKCIVEVNFAKLKIFEAKLLKDFGSLTNEASYFSCLQDCGECRVSMSVETLQSFLPYSNLNEEEKHNFTRLSTIGKSYFSGIKATFFKCLNCDEFSIFTKTPQMICKNCIRTMLRERVSFEAAEIIIKWSSTLEMVSGSGWMEKSFHLVHFDEVNSTYYHQPHTDPKGYSCHIIPKLRRINRNEPFLILRALEMSISNDDYLVIDNHVNDVMLICVAIAR